MARWSNRVLALAVVLAFLPVCRSGQAQANHADGGTAENAPVASFQIRQIIHAAIEQTGYTHRYDPSYLKLTYPGGDVPREGGVCTDVIVRAFRSAGVDLQKEVHEDMIRSFSAYPNSWGLRSPDANIDHRRVPNLMTYFKRQGKAVPKTSNPEDYKPGDVVAWDLGGGILHIGIATDVRSAGGRLKFVHNIGQGARLEDTLFLWKIIGHYRYF